LLDENSACVTFGHQAALSVAISRRSKERVGAV
jgi:hypothetical protein